MALAELAVDFKVRGADQSLRQFDRLAQSVTKLGSTVDRQSGVVRNAFSTMLGVLSGNAVSSVVDKISSGMTKILSLPGELMESRMQLSKGLGDLVGAGVDRGQLRQIETDAHNFASKWGHVTTESYVNAFYEVQSSVGHASKEAKREIAESMQILASVGGLTPEQSVQMGAKWLHMFGLTNLPEKQMVSKVKQLAAQFKAAVDVGVFRGPDLMESLKESVPLLTQKGWDSASIFAASTFWQSRGFQGSSTGVAMREWGQRITPAAAWMKVAGDVYEKQGEAGLQRLMKNTGKFKDQYIQAQKYLFESGFSSGGMKRQAEEYMKYIERIPAWTRDHMRKRGEHEALQPYVNSMMENYNELKRIHKAIESGNFGSLKLLAEDQNGLSDKVMNRATSAFKSLRQVLATPFENTWNLALQDIIDKLDKVKKHIEVNRHSYERGIGAGTRGFWQNIAIDQEGPLGGLKQKAEDYMKAIESKNQLEIAMQSYELGKSVAESFNSAINSVIGKDGVMASIAGKMDAVVGSMRSAASDLNTIGSAIASIARFFGQTPPQPSDKVAEESRRIEPDTFGESEKWLNHQRKMGQDAGPMREIVDGLLSVVKRLEGKPWGETPATARLEGPISGTLNITGNTATLNANAGTNKTNAATTK